MSGVLKVIGKVAGVIATIATFVAVITGNPLAAAIATIATVVAGVANLGVAIMQGAARPPPARGSVTRITIDPNAAQPCILGRCYYGGVLRHDTAYGPTLEEVPNPYRGMVVSYSGCGPVKSISPRVDFATVASYGSYYTGYLYTSTQLGACPESGALTPNFSGMPNWGSSYKLSGECAALWNFKFDKAGKVFASGLPLFGAIVEGVKCYDPRKDSTFPGGSGTHRLNDPTTWEYTENPALHAGTYAYGRYQNGRLVFGVGMPSTAVVWSDVASWANTCQANGWTTGGIIYEPGDRWNNLKEICAAGGAEPVFANGQLGFFWSAPRTALATVTDDDILGDDSSVIVMQPWRERLNAAIPQYRSEAHNWEIVSAETVSVPTYVTADGEEKVETWPFNLCTQADQAAELATYRVVNGREMVINLVVGPQWRAYRPGDCLHIQSDQLDLDTPAIIVQRTLDPGTMRVTLTLISETDEKHAYALGLTAVPPPTPVLQMSSSGRDGVMDASNGRDRTNLIYKRAATKPSTPADSPGIPATWYDDALSVPSADQPMWECFGVRKAGAANFVWQSPLEALPDSRVFDGLDGDGTVKDGNVGTGAVQDSAITLSSTFLSGTSWTIPGTGTWYAINQGGVPCTTSITTGPGGTQVVLIKAILILQRNGGSNDNFQVRCKRSDGTVLPETYAVDAQFELMTHAFQFTDVSPGASVTRTYTLEVQSDDVTSVLKSTVHTQLAKR